MKTIKLEIPEAHWNLLVKLGATYHGEGFWEKESDGNYYSTDSVLCVLTEEEYQILMKLYN